MMHSVVNTAPRVVDDRVHLQPGEAAARLDRLPLSRLHWGLALITQATYGIVISLDASAMRFYPAIWEPAGTITPLEYTILFMVQVGIGLLVGEWIFGLLSDRFGRKRILMIAIALAGCAFFFLAFNSNFWYQLGFSAVSALGVGGMLSINVVYMQEIAPPKIRARVSQASQALGLFISGIGTGILAAFLIPADYRIFIFALAGAAILIDLPLVAFGLPESPRWLESKGHEAQALKVLERMERTVSRGGRRPLPEPDIAGTFVGETAKVPMRELFSSAFRGRTIMLAVVWTLIYAGAVYGYAQYIGVFMIQKGFTPASLFLIMGIGSGLGGVIAILIISALGERVERKSVIFVGSVLMAIGIVASGLTNNQVIVAAGTILAFLSMAIMFTNLYIYTANAYPTRLRSLGTGWTDGIGHNGAVWGPFVATALFLIPGLGGWGWLLWVAVPGALLPGLLMLTLGKKQAGISLEKITE
jgi:MFS family permease